VLKEERPAVQAKERALTLSFLEKERECQPCVNGAVVSRMTWHNAMQLDDPDPKMKP
jgi:hypothetical protein